MNYIFKTLFVCVSSILFGSCNYTSQDNLAENISQKQGAKTDVITTASIIECEKSFAEQSLKYSLSPSGKYLVKKRETAIPFASNFEIFELETHNKFSFKPKGFFTTSELNSGNDFSWTIDDKIIYSSVEVDGYHSLDFTSSYKKQPVIEFNNPLASTKRFGNNYPLGQMNFSDEMSNHGFSSFYSGWQFNMFGAPAVRVIKGQSFDKSFQDMKAEELITIDISKTKNFLQYAKYFQDLINWRLASHGSRGKKPTLSSDIPFDTILKINSQNNYFKIFPNDAFSPFQIDEPIEFKQIRSDKLHFLSNNNVNEISLFEYSHDIKKIKLVENLSGLDISDVSFDRLGKTVHWINYTKGFPSSKAITKTGEILLDIVQLDSPFSVKLQDINMTGSRAIIRRDSFVNGTELLLVDTATKTIDKLISCENQNRKPWAKISELNLQASDGEDLWGVVYTPINDNDPISTIVYAHGGPSYQYKVSRGDIMTKQLVDLGYRVVFVNYRGSTGYGKSFREQGWKDFSRARLDLVETGNYLTSKYLLDENKLFLMGDSHGGFLSLGTAGLEEHPYNAIIARNSMTDLVELLTRKYELKSGGINKYNAQSQVFGDTTNEQVLEKLRQNSPINNLNNIDTPILIFHAIDDDKVPFVQGENFYQALKKNRPDLNVEFVSLSGGHQFNNVESVEEYTTNLTFFLNKLAN